MPLRRLWALSLISAAIVLSSFARAAGDTDTLVYFDPDYPFSWITEGAAEEVRDFLVTLGFTPADSEELAGWMKEKTAGGAAGSAVVMTQGTAPATVVGPSPGPDAPLRKYLDAGGTVIWIADVPFYWIGGPARHKEKWDYLGGRGVLGFDTVGNWEGRSRASITGTGSDWNLEHEWTSVRAVKPGDVDRKLAVDADGNVSAWTKSYSGGQPGFVRLWDTSITDFTDGMGEDLYRVISNTVEGFEADRRVANIYMFRPSDYYPLFHLDSDGLDREVQVQVFDASDGEKKYVLKIHGGNELLETIPLFEGYRSFYKKNLRVPVLRPNEKLSLALVSDRGEEVIDEAVLDGPALHCEVSWAALPSLNPVDLGTFLVPADRIVSSTRQKISVTASCIIPGSGPARQVRYSLQVVDRDRESHTDLSREIDATPGEPFVFEVTTSGGLAPGRYLARFTAGTDGGEMEEKKWLLVREPAGEKPGFGAYFATIDYEGPVPYYDREEQEWSRLDWEKVWRRGPHEDVVFAFPGGQRFVFWRGSSYVPFWASKENVGLTYEWVESAYGRGGLVDCIEPLQDKECRFSRPYIVSSTPARAIVKWRYALVDLEYTIADEEWAEETYTFYPDGFGVRKASGYILPLNWHEASEFIVLTPAGVNPFDVFPDNVVDIMSPDGSRRETVSYPRPEREWPEGGLAVFRVHWHERDPFTPVMAVRTFNHFIVQYDGWKVDGRYISPSYWGVHWPVTRGYPTTRSAPPGWRERPAHASLMAIDSEPDRRIYYNKQLEAVTWTWLIGNTDAPDERVLEIARSWIGPVEMEVARGGGAAEYDAGQRAYVVETGGGPVELRAGGAAGDKAVNPAFVLENFDGPVSEVRIDGKKLGAGDYRTGVERPWEGAAAVLWIDGSVQAGSKITIR